MAEDRESRPLKERIQRLMMSQHLRTPSELAARAGVSKGAFLMFWRGDTDTPRRSTLIKLADALHVSLAVIQGEEPGPIVEDLPSVEITLDGEDLDVFQAMASIRRVATAEILEGELAVVARAREDDPIIQAVVRSIRAARQGDSGPGSSIA